MSSMEDMYTDFRASRVSSAHYITVITSFRIYLSNRSFVYLLIVLLLFFYLFLQLPPIHVPSTSFILLERIQQRFLECNLPNGII